MNLGMGELIVIMCVILLLFGGKKLPELARSLGLGIREFKKACQDPEENTPKKEEKPLEISRQQTIEDVRDEKNQS